MSTHDLVVIGASAGGIEALTQLVGELPADLEAAVFVVVHTPANARSELPRLLARAGPLPAAHVADAEPVECGRIRVAPPGLHLLVKPGFVRLVQGPPEHGFRPAIDPLFRSAASAYGPRTVAVALSGVLDDGSAGAREVEAAGGRVLVQDVEEATFPDLPANVADACTSAESLTIAELARRITTLTRIPAAAALDDPPTPDPLELAVSRHGTQQRDQEGGQLPAVCPDCGGPLRVVAGRDEVPVFRCHVGHAWGGRSLLDAQGVQIEGSLWTVVRLLEERSELAQRLRERAAERDLGRAVRRYDEQIDDIEQQLEHLRSLLAAGGAASSAG
ncbi:chemotaxis protein CheB [Egicoccus sp. AB-alg2]|uniref:chemotaxis protein CheB n=1 Tax=Egicoccus sp. AB-alg2 TaxID=3242693 RepID=UPI00359D59CD